MRFDTHGVYHSAFNLLADARLYDDLGKRPEIRFYRDSEGRIDGVELLTPAGETCPECRGEGVLDVGAPAVFGTMPCPSCGGSGLV